MRAILHADREWGIGRNNDLMFSLPRDMKFFRETTKGKVVVMGLNTLLSFPNGKPLKNRVNIVLCPDDVNEDVITVHTPAELFAEAKKYPADDVFVIGGAVMSASVAAGGAVFAAGALAGVFGLAVSIRFQVRKNRADAAPSAVAEVKEESRRAEEEELKARLDAIDLLCGYLKD